MVDEAPALAVHRGGHAPAAVVADDQHVLHLEHVYGELQHRQIVRILRRGEVGDVAVDKELAGLQAHDFIRGYPAVGAADPLGLGTRRFGRGSRPVRAARRLCVTSGL